MKILHLSFVPFPLHHESPTSTIQRTARANGFKNCEKLLAFVTKSTSLSTSGNCLLDNSSVSRALQTCLPEEPDRIKRNFYHSTRPAIMRSKVVVNGVEVSYLILRRNDSALCTACLKEQHEKFPKDITLFSNCPFHNRAFLFKCPNCNTQIEWKIQLTNHCKCGKRLVSPQVQASDMAPDHHLLRLFEEGDQKTIASIQRTLTNLEKETSTNDDAVKSARRALAVAINRQDVESMKNAIHNCLPCSSTEEIDLILTIFNTELSEPIISALRQKLISTTAEQNSSVATVTLSVEKLQRYLGISRSFWYTLKRHNTSFEDIGRGAKTSLKDAMSIKKMLAFDKAVDRDLNQQSSNTISKEIFSVSAVQYLTNLPEETIKNLALNTNILGPKTQHTKQIENGTDILFVRSDIKRFTDYYVCSHQIAHELNIPLADVEETIRTYKFKLKKFDFIQETTIIKKTKSSHLSLLIKNPLPNPAPRKRKYLNVSPLTPLDTGGFLTLAESAKLLSIAKSELRTLVSEQIIPCYRKDSSGRYVISKKDILNFGKKHIRVLEIAKLLNIYPGSVWTLLKSIGIMPISGPSINHGLTHFYTKSSISRTIINLLKKHPQIIPNLKKTDDEKLDTDTKYCVNTNTIIKNFSITKPCFYMKFLASGFIKYENQKTGKYITKKDSRRVTRILKNYISYEEAAVILNVPRDYIWRLVKRNKLTLENSPFSPFKNPGLVSHAQVEKLRLNLR